MKNYYTILGVAHHAETEVIAAAYKALMRKYHPDLNRGDENVIKAQAINEAYETLSSPENRRAYDAAQRQATGANGNSPPPRQPPQPPPTPPSSKNNAGPAVPVARPKNGWNVTVAAFFVTAVAITFFALQSANENAPDAVTVVEESKSVGAVADDEALSEDNSEAPNIEESIPTIGQFTDNIHKAVNHFANIYAQQGVMGAEAFSRECSQKALGSSDILSTDYCVAFDMAAMTTDLAAVNPINMPHNQHFKLRASQIDDEYTRFQQVSGNRTEQIWNEVNNMLENSILSAQGPVSR